MNRRLRPRRSIRTAPHICCALLRCSGGMASCMEHLAQARFLSRRTPFKHTMACTGAVRYGSAVLHRPRHRESCAPSKLREQRAWSLMAIPNSCANWRAEATKKQPPSGNVSLQLCETGRCCRSACILQSPAGGNPWDRPLQGTSEGIRKCITAPGERRPRFGSNQTG